MFAPSLGSLVVTGLLLLILLYLFVQNVTLIKRLDIYQKLSLLSLLAIAVGIHGLIHLGVESVYGFNPYNWI